MTALTYCGGGGEMEMLAADLLRFTFLSYGFYPLSFLVGKLGDERGQ